MQRFNGVSATASQGNFAYVQRVYSLLNKFVSNAFPNKGVQSSSARIQQVTGRYESPPLTTMKRQKIKRCGACVPIIGAGKDHPEGVERGAVRREGRGGGVKTKEAAGARQRQRVDGRTGLCRVTEG